MKRYLLVLSLFSLAFSCAHVPPPVRDFGVCLNREISPQVPAVIGEVETALAAGDYVALLVDLGKRVGFAVVDCAVHEVLGASRARMMAAPNDELAPIKASHAEDWLARR